jgi:hypothetical protein
LLEQPKALVIIYFNSLTVNDIVIVWSVIVSLVLSSLLYYLWLIWCNCCHHGWFKLMVFPVLNSY